jgi:hypothetical protein
MADGKRERTLVAAKGCAEGVPSDTSVAAYFRSRASGGRELTAIQRVIAHKTDDPLFLDAGYRKKRRPAGQERAAALRRYRAWIYRVLPEFRRRLESMAMLAMPRRPSVAGSGTADADPAICAVGLATSDARLAPWVLKALSISV